MEEWLSSSGDGFVSADGIAYIGNPRFEKQIDEAAMRNCHLQGFDACNLNSNFT